MMSTREERKISDTIARIERLEQEEAEVRATDRNGPNGASSGSKGTIRKRKRSNGPPSTSPTGRRRDSSSSVQSSHANGSRNYVSSRQNSPSVHSREHESGSEIPNNGPSPRRRRQESVDDDGGSERTTDDDIDWLPPKLILVRKFFRTREKDLAKFTPDSISSREKAESSEPVSPMTSEVSSRKSDLPSTEANQNVRIKPKSASPDMRSQSPIRPVKQLSPLSPRSTDTGKRTKSQSPAPKKDKKPNSPIAESGSDHKPPPLAVKSPVLRTPIFVAETPTKPENGPELANLFSDSTEPKNTWDPSLETTVQEQIPPQTPAPRPQEFTAPPSVAQSALKGSALKGSTPSTVRTFATSETSPVPPCVPSSAPPATNGQIATAPLSVSVPPSVSAQPSVHNQQSPSALSATTPSATAANNPMQSPFAPTPSPVTPGVVQPPPPRPVKKLSFADYRKKQLPVAVKEKEVPPESEAAKE
ncbi:hypothetical protein V1512DRAFT_264241 [Lipomyces arxii]|uniref:uncharacterized protein n=1 Tax=Lipomyces arxii TaxID=56418 RepID=UPI0034CED1F7